MAHFSKPNLKQRADLSGNTCPTCKGNGNGSGMLIYKSNEMPRTVECRECGDSFTKPTQSLR